jgi:hypothetical protein
MKDMSLSLLRAAAHRAAWTFMSPPIEWHGGILAAAAPCVKGEAVESVVRGRIVRVALAFTP